METLLNQEIVEIQGYEMSYMSNQVNFSGDYLYIQLSVYNTNDGGKTLHGDFFTIDGVVTGAHFVNGPNWQQLYTYATYFQPFETQVIWLEVSVDDTDNYFENHNHVDLFCNGIFIQRIEIEN